MSCECKRQGDLCDPCTDLLATGEQQERERIIALLEARRDELASCRKDDDCSIHANAIDVCISDIKGEAQ